SGSVVESSEPAGQPQQAADGLPQGHGCLVDDLEGDGQFGRGVPLHARGQGVVGGEDDAEVVARVQVPQYGGGPVGLGAVAERGQQTGGTPADGDGLRSFRGAGGRGTTGDGFAHDTPPVR